MKLSGIFFACVFSAVAAQSLAAKRPLVVGAEQAQTRIVMLDPDVVSPEPAKIVWEWRPAKDEKLIVAKLSGKFSNPSECKPSDDGKRILVCASNCGFAVVDVATTNAVAAGCVNLPGKCANLHSICELPDGNLVVAGSQAGGLMIVDIKSKPFSRSSHVTTNAYRGAHGVLWDAKRNCLWATGEKPLTRFFYDPKTKTLKRDKSWNVEKPFSYLCGHDLVWGDKEHNRIASTLGNGISVLDLESADKTDMMEISETLPGSVKGLSYAGGERLAVYLDKTAFKGMPWTTINIHVDGNGASRVYTLPGSGFYKAHFFLGSLAP